MNRRYEEDEKGALRPAVVRRVADGRGAKQEGAQVRAAVPSSSVGRLRQRLQAPAADEPNALRGDYTKLPVLAGNPRGSPPALPSCPRNAFGSRDWDTCWSAGGWKFPLRPDESPLLHAITTFLDEPHATTTDPRASCALRCNGGVRMYRCAFHRLGAKWPDLVTKGFAARVPAPGSWNSVCLAQPSGPAAAFVCVCVGGDVVTDNVQLLHTTAVVLVVASSTPTGQTSFVNCFLDGAVIAPHENIRLMRVSRRFVVVSIGSPIAWMIRCSS
jgi:hypothetical protein